MTHNTRETKVVESVGSYRKMHTSCASVDNQIYGAALQLSDPRKFKMSNNAYVNSIHLLNICID